jgi:4a-hydroxytetrahydrobiopterin dehydratase
MNEPISTTITSDDLLAKKSIRAEHALDARSVDEYLAALSDWSLVDGFIQREFRFKNYYQTLAFVNAIAYVIHAEDHHPELSVSYNRCLVRYNTHSVNDDKGGLSENDFICAAKIDAVFMQNAEQSPSA